MNVKSTPPMTNGGSTAYAPTFAAPGPRPAEPPVTAATAEVSREQLEVAVDRANEQLKADGSLRFAVHEGTNRIVVRIVDPVSMAIIREFPDTDFLDMMAKLQELSGLQVNLQT